MNSLNQPIPFEKLLQIIGMLFVQSQMQTEKIQQLEKELNERNNSRDSKIS